MACDGCYNIVQRSTDFKNIAIIQVKKTAYRVYFKDISKHKAKKLMNKFNLVGKTGNICCNDQINHSDNSNKKTKK